MTNGKRTAVGTSELTGWLRVRASQQREENPSVLEHAAAGKDKLLDRPHARERTRWVGSAGVLKELASLVFARVQQQQQQ